MIQIFEMFELTADEAEAEVARMMLVMSSLLWVPFEFLKNQIDNMCVVC
jgi:hypothetical protein